MGRECRQERLPQPPAETTAPGTPRASPPTLPRGAAGAVVPPAGCALPLPAARGPRVLLPPPLPHLRARLGRRFSPSRSCALAAPAGGGVVVKAGPGRGGGGGVCVSRSCRRRGRGREPRAGACAQGSPPPPPPSCPRRGGVAGRPPSQSGGEGGERASGRQCARGG